MILEMHGQVPPVERFGSCALVGSSAAMRGASLGQEIDKHDTVIRVNRLPDKAVVADVGERTDVYFKNTIADYNGTHVWARHFSASGHGDRRSTPDRWCSLSDELHECGFDSVVYEGFRDASKWRRGDTAIPTGHQSDALHAFEHQVEALGEFKFPDPEEA